MKGPFLLEYLTIGISNFSTEEGLHLYFVNTGALSWAWALPLPQGGHRSDNEMVISRGAIDQMMRWSLAGGL